MQHRLSCALAFAVLALSSPAGAQSPEQQKAIVTRVFDEIFNQARFDVAGELYAADFVNHGFSRDIGLKADHDALRAEMAALPDLHMTIEKQLVDGEFVTVLWHATGTDTGGFAGMPPTGKPVRARGITIWRIVDGRIREEWSQFDETRLMFQVGLLVPATPK